MKRLCSKFELPGRPSFMNKALVPSLDVDLVCACAKAMIVKSSATARNCVIVHVIIRLESQSKVYYSISTIVVTFLLQTISSAVDVEIDLRSDAVRC